MKKPNKTTLLSRNQPAQSLGEIEYGHDSFSSEGLSALNTSDPHSNDFSTKIKGTPADIVVYLLARQRRVYGKTILESQEFKINYMALLVGAKCLLGKQYTVDEIIRGIEIALQQSNWPSSFKFVEEKIIEWRSNNL